MRKPILLVSSQHLKRRLMTVKYRLVMFDFDGTLANSFPWFLTSVNRAAEKFSFRRVESTEIDVLRGLSAREIVGRLGLPMWKLPQLGSFMQDLMAQERDRIPLFDGVGELLTALEAARVSTALLTSNSKENVTHVLGPCNASLISYYECGVSLLGKAKKFRRLLNASGVSAHEAVYVGDELRDVEAAASVGVDFIGVAWGYTQPAALARATRQPPVASFGELQHRVLG